MAKTKTKEPRYFRERADYKTAFSEAVTELIDEKITDRDVRMARIQSLIDEYVEAIGETPDGNVLERLTNEILREEISDDHPDKMTREEYPIMTERQLVRRHGTEVPEIVAEEVGTDGKNYRLPKRRKRTKRENAYIDKSAKIRNDERRRNYRKETQAGEIMAYNANLS